MHEINEYDEFTLGAFVDGQLDEETSESIINAMENNSDIRESVYELRRAKDLMKIGFSGISLSEKDNKTVSQWSRFYLAIAASITAITLSLGSGYFGYYYATQNPLSNRIAESSTIEQKSDRILLHISESNIEHFTSALDYVEDFLLEHQANGGEIAVIANAGGLDIMRAGISPYENKIINLMEKYNNIHFIACANSVKSLQKKGVNVNLIQQVRLNKPAMDHIIEYVQDGWTYQKMETQTKI